MPTVQPVASPKSNVPGLLSAAGRMSYSPLQTTGRVSEEQRLMFQFEGT